MNNTLNVILNLNKRKEDDTMDGIKTITFDDVKSTRMNKTLNNLKKNAFMYINQRLLEYYEPLAKADTLKELEQSIRRIADAIARDITDGNSSVSQKMFAITKNMEVCLGSQYSQEEQNKARGKVDDLIKKINETLEDDMITSMIVIKDYIHEKTFDPKVITTIKGVGWKTASNLYLALDGNSSADIPYVKVYLQYEVFEDEATRKQRLWLTHDEISKRLKQVINDGIDTYDVHEVKSMFDKVIDKVLNDKDIVTKVKLSSLGINEPAYASTLYYKQFYELFDSLNKRIHESDSLVSDDYVRDGSLDGIIHEVEEELGFEFTIEQKQAIYASCQNSVFLLTGLAGTGKSTSVKAIIRIYEKLGYPPSSILGTSFTGQATYNLRQSVDLLPTQCATAHRWLACNKYLPSDVELNVPRFKEVKLLVIDEFSMVSLDLMNQILNGLKENEDVKILFVGDIGQIPSIDVGFAYDFLMSEIGQQIELKEVVRQKSDSIVPEIANEVREGQIHSVLLNENYKGKNFRFISKVGVEFMAYQAMKAFMSYESKYAENIQDMQILTNTLRIANQINDYIQNERSKKGKLDNYRYMYDPNLDRYFHVNDRIVIRRNINVLDEDDETKIVFNGAKGYIKSIEFDVDPEQLALMYQNVFTEETASHELANVKSVEIQFDNDDLGLIRFDANTGITRDISLAYATTIHKSQGSTHEHTILVVGRAEMLNSSQLIYTGITRTSKTLTLISSPNIIKDSVSVNAYRNARTLYQDIIKSINKNSVF